MRRGRLPIAAMAAGALGLAAALPAQADLTDDHVDGGTDGSGLVAVAVSLSGNGLDGGGGSDGSTDVGVSVQVPARCWWDTLSFMTGETAWQIWGESTGNMDTPGGHHYETSFVPPTLEQLAAHRDEEGLWATVTQYTGDGDIEAGIQCYDELVAANGGIHAVWVAEGTTPPQPPPPPVPPEMLAEVAFEHLALPVPDTLRSPGADSYVNLPTWFWVAPGDGPRDGFVRLEVTATAGENSATVVADPDRLTVRSSGGPTAACSAEQARTSYGSGTPEAAGCSLTHARSSARAPGLAYTVSAVGAYVASWTGQEGGTPVAGGGLGTVVSPASSVGLPVAEVQTVVIR